MRDESLDELISAYLDGEVTAEERVFVERQLADSPASRQLFEQLRRQRQLLRGLAKRPAHDFGPAVLHDLHRLGLDAELLSAYLDDEITPAERNQVEAQLAGSPERQQLLQQLQGQRQSLQALPRDTLDANFAHRVLAELDRRGLRDDLLSGHLDDRISADDRAKIDLRLAPTADDRQMLDGLRAQRDALQSLPRRTLDANFSSRVVAEIDRLRVAADRNASILKPATTAPGKQTWQRSWSNAGIMVGALAAGLLLALMVNNWPQRSTTEFSPVSVVMSDEELNVAADMLLAQVNQAPILIMIYDVLVTPAGRQNKTVENLLAKAGIPLNKSVTVSGRLEKELLAGQFFGNDAIARQSEEKKRQDDVEVVYVRGTSRQISAFHEEFRLLESRGNRDISIKVDMATGSEDLRTLMKLSAVASGNTLAQIKADPRATSVFGSFKLEFGDSLHSVSLSRLATIRAPAPQIKINNPPAPIVIPDLTPKPDSVRTEKVANELGGDLANPADAKLDWNSPDQPGHAILILRNLRQ